MLGASAALALSGIPFKGPIGAASVGYADGKYLLNPTTKAADLAARPRRRRHADAVLMVESEARDAAPSRHARRRRVRPRADAGRDQGDQRARRQGRQAGLGLEARREIEAELATAVAAHGRRRTRKAYQIIEKQARHTRIGEIKKRWSSARGRRNAKYDAAQVSDELGRLEYNIVRRRIIAGEPRIDGRDMHTVRQITRRDRRAATHARLGAVHARRDAGARDDHARHRPRRADHRCARRRAQRAVHAALQLPAVLGGRDRHDGFAEAPRNRPRQPGRAAACRP